VEFFWLEGGIEGVIEGRVSVIRAQVLLRRVSLLHIYFVAVQVGTLDLCFLSV
jgi:hypothetical protein